MIIVAGARHDTVVIKMAHWPQKKSIMTLLSIVSLQSTCASKHIICTVHNAVFVRALIVVKLRVVASTY